MKKLFKLSLVLLVGAVLFAACSDDDSENLPGQNEVTVEPFTVADNAVTIKCSYHPDKSVAYQLQIGDTLSEKYSKGRFLKILNLSPGREYTLSITIFDATQNAIGRSKVSFSTTKSPSSEDQITVMPITFEEVDM